MDSTTLKHIIEYFPNSNFKYSEYDLNENNLRHGVYESWHSNGQLWVRSNYQNGLLHGLYYSWHRNGRMEERINYYQNGLIHGVYEVYNTNGSLDSSRFYINGKFECLIPQI